MFLSIRLWNSIMNACTGTHTHTHKAAQAHNNRIRAQAWGDPACTPAQLRADQQEAAEITWGAGAPGAVKEQGAEDELTVAPWRVPWQELTVAPWHVLAGAAAATPLGHSIVSSWKQASFYCLLMVIGIILLSPHGHRRHSIVCSWSQASFYCLLRVTGIILLPP